MHVHEHLFTSQKEKEETARSVSDGVCDGGCWCLFHFLTVMFLLEKRLVIVITTRKRLILSSKNKSHLRHGA